MTSQSIDLSSWDTVATTDLIYFIPSLIYENIEEELVQLIKALKHAFIFFAN